MLEFHEINIDHIWEEVKDLPLIKNLYMDNFKEPEYYQHLRESIILAVCDGIEFLGFFSVDDVGEGEAEVHAFILPQFRRKSKEIIEACKGELFHNWRFKRVITCVSSDFGYIVRFLTMSGFLLNSVKRNEVPRNGMFHDLYILTLEGDV